MIKRKSGKILQSVFSGLKIVETRAELNILVIILFYWKSWRELKIMTNPISVNLAGKIVYCNNAPVYGLREVIQFDSFFKLFYGSGYTKLAERKNIKIVRDITESKEIKNFIDYLKAVAALLPLEDGQNFFIESVK